MSLGTHLSRMTSKEMDHAALLSIEITPNLVRPVFFSAKSHGQIGIFNSFKQITDVANALLKNKYLILCHLGLCHCSYSST